MAEVISEPAQEEEEEDYWQPADYPTYLRNQEILNRYLFSNVLAYIGNRREMVLDIIRLTQPIRKRFRYNLMVVTKAKPKAKPKPRQEEEEEEEDIELERLIELHRVIQSLASRNLTLLLAELPEDAPQSVSLDSLLGGTQLLSKNLITDADIPKNATESNRRLYIEKLLVDTKDSSGAKAGLFWDVEEYPFSVFDPAEIYKKIEQALHKQDPRLQKGMNNISIQAYVDHTKKGSWNQFLSNKTWDASLCLLPGGSKTLRLERMLHDILLWTVDTKPIYILPTYLFVISDQARDDMKFLRNLRHLNALGYSVLLPVLKPNEYAPEESEREWLIVDDTVSIDYYDDSESKKQKLGEGSGSQHQG